MNAKVLSLLFSALLFVSFSSFGQASKTKWVRLGSKSIDFKLDRDVLKVGAKRGKFSKLKIGVTGSPINMHRMVIEYVNGSKEEIQLKQTFGKKTTSRVIDIKGNQRFIKDITFVYDTKNRAKGKGKIHIFGRR